MSKILLGMSGGIDSSVAAWLLKRDAYDVVGVTFLFHDGPLQKDALDRAVHYANDLGIEHHIVDMREQFAHLVRSFAIEQFEMGNYPNPCTLCTPQLKIPALFEQAERFGCDIVATGHYARIAHNKEGFELLPYQLMRPLDKFKDQTYLLYTLTQEHMAHMMFPLEDMHKGEVRRLAMQAGLMRVAPVNDGQGEPCLYEGRHYINWLETNGGFTPDTGDIVYIGDNSKVGEYKGQYRYAPDASLGTFSITSEEDHASADSVLSAMEEQEGPSICQEGDAPVSHEEELFVVFKDPANKRIYAAPRAMAGAEMCLLRDVHWTSIEAPREKRSCRARLSYGRKPLPAQVICNDDGIIVSFNERVRGLYAGQAVVLYSDDLVLGGGIVAG